MKLFFKIAVSTFIVLAASGCSKTSVSSDSSKSILAVSIDPQRKMLEELAGDKFEITTMLTTGANPESFEPSVALRKKAAQAKAYFTIGYLPFETTLTKSLSSDTHVVNTSNGITVLTGTHSHADDEHSHGEADPHVWTSLRNGKILAANMVDELITIDPDNADTYKARYEEMSHRLDSLDSVVAQQLHGVHGFAVWHPSLSYLANDYGLHQIAVGQESKETSMAVLKAVIDEARQDSVKVFFFQKEYDSRQAENINKEIGARMVTINPLSYDWENEIINIADELSKR